MVHTSRGLKVKFLPVDDAATGLAASLWALSRYREFIDFDFS